MKRNIFYRLAKKVMFPLVEKINSIEARLSNLQTNMEAYHSDLSQQISFTRNRTINYYKARWDVIDFVGDYLVNAEIQGDYAEFGVFKGTTFGYCANLFAPLFPSMRFLAFDSFQGLPDPRGIDRVDNFSSGFYKGQFACPEEEFLNNVKTAAPTLNPDRIITIPGWFDKTLNSETINKIHLSKLACVYIDCDLYESTVSVCKFIRPMLSVGTVILFDDWRGYRNLPEYGQQRACKEWLEADSYLTLVPFISFGSQGQSFTVHTC